MASYIAVKVYGPGHVVAYNYVANFHDGIDIETYGNPDGSARRSTARTIRRSEYLGPAAGRDRLLQQLHDQLSRQPVRDRRQHAQRARDAEHDDQLGVARVLQPAGDRRADLLDPQHRLSPARRIDAADQRLGGRALLQQHHPVGDARAGRVERALARTTCFSARTRRRRSSASTPTPTTARRTTTASGRIPARRTRSSGTRRRGRRLPTTSRCCADAAAAPARRRRSRRGSSRTLDDYSARDAVRISTASSSTTTCS